MARSYSAMVLHKSYYEQGVKESFRLTGTTTAYGAAAATTLLTSGFDLSDWTASPDKLKAIWMQKWLALTNYSGLESWSEYRKNNFPVTPPSANYFTNCTTSAEIILSIGRSCFKWSKCDCTRYY